MTLMDVLSLISELLRLITELDGLSASDSGFKFWVIGFAGVINKKNN